MATKYATGKRAWGICGRSGRKMLLKDMVFDGRYPNMRVDPAWFEPKDPLDYAPRINDPVALWRPAPQSDLVTATLESGDINFGALTFEMSWTGTSGPSMIVRYDLYSRDDEDDAWVLYDSYEPVYDMFGGVVDAATSDDLPLAMYLKYFRVIATDAMGNAGAAFSKNPFMNPILSVVSVDEDTGDVSIEWTETDGSANYQIQVLDGSDWVTIETVDNQTFDGIVPAQYATETIRVLGMVDDVEAPSNEIDLSDTIGYTVEFHIFGGNIGETTHISGLDASSLRDTAPGDGRYSIRRDPSLDLFYGNTTGPTVVYGDKNADSGGGAAPGSTAYSNTTFTPTQTVHGQLAYGWNPVKRIFWSIQNKFDDPSPRYDFYYQNSPGSFIPLTTQTAAFDRGFRINTWMDELGCFYVTESAFGQVKLKKFPGIGEPPQIGNAYSIPSVLLYGTGHAATNMSYGYGEVFIPELGYLYMPRLATQSNDTANPPSRIPFSSSYDINLPLSGILMSGINGAATFAYSDDLGILVAGITSAYNATPKPPAWSEDAGTTWTPGTDLSSAGLLTRCPYISWEPKISAFIASSEQITNQGQWAYISEDGKNWILLGRFRGTATGGTYGHAAILQYALKPLPAEYPALDPGVGSTTSGAVLSNGNLTVTTASGESGNRSSTIGRYKGKWYWEVSADAGSAFTGMCSGVLRRGISPDVQKSYVGTPRGSAFVTVNPGAGWNKYVFSSSPTSIGAGTALSVGGRVCIAMDLDAGKIWFGQNGTWLDGDPALGTGGTTLPPSVYTPVVGCVFPPTGGISYTFHPNPANWLYVAPTGFSALSRQTY